MTKVMKTVQGECFDEWRWEREGWASFLDVIQVRKVASGDCFDSRRGGVMTRMSLASFLDVTKVLGDCFDG